MQRRKFLSSALSVIPLAMLAPNLITAGAPETPDAEVIHDDTALIQGMLDRGEPILHGTYRISGPIFFRDHTIIRSNLFFMEEPARFFAKDVCNIEFSYNNLVFKPQHQGHVRAFDLFGNFDE